MNTNFRRAPRQAAALALAAVMITAAAGCNTSKTPAVDDSTLTAQVQQKLAGDSAIASEPVQVISQGGVITLTGAVSNAAARSLAANDASTVAGVQKVVNNITVNPATAPVSAAATTPLPVPQPEPTPRERASVEPPPARRPAPITRVDNPPPPPPQQQQAQAQPQPVAPPPPPPPPPKPEARLVTLPSGSTLPIRINQTLDSATTQPGETFTGAMAVDVVADGMVVLPRGTAVTGKVDEVHEAAHFKGSSLLTVELTGVNPRGERISVTTQPYSVQGKGRGENTAVKTGVGAAAGAILGGIFGGGKGAAIGAAAGGGTGAGINAVTRGQQVQIPSESIVRFITTNSIAVRTSVHAGDNPSDAPTLHDHTDR